MQAAASSLVTRSVNTTLLRGTLATTPMMLMAPVAYLDNRWAVARNKAASLGVVVAAQIASVGSTRPVSFVG